MTQPNTISNTNVEMQENPPRISTPSKKRSLHEFVKSQQLVARFKAKSDFVQYFSESRK